MKDFFINSFPRTGSTFLKNSIRLFLENPAIKDQIHSSFLAGKKVEDTVQLIVAREPIGAISSLLYKDFGDYIFRYSKDKDIEDSESYFKDGIKQNINFYLSWYNELYTNALNNKDCYVFFFQDFTKDILDSLTKISEITESPFKTKETINPEIRYVLEIGISSENVLKAVFNHMKESTVSPINTKTFGNLPRSKSNEYYQIKEYLIGQDRLQESIEIYNELLKRR